MKIEATDHQLAQKIQDEYYNKSITSTLNNLAKLRGESTLIQNFNNHTKQVLVKVLRGFFFVHFINY